MTATVDDYHKYPAPTEEELDRFEKQFSWYSLSTRGMNNEPTALHEVIHIGLRLIHDIRCLRRKLAKCKKDLKEYEDAGLANWLPGD